jgi:hypothetical protein
MSSLRNLVGREHELERVSLALNQFAQELRPGVIGAYQISCSDESERECVEAFHERFVRPLLPELKFWSKSSFRTANLGARYEEGAVPIIEDHFSTPAAAQSFKLLVVKLNAHVSVTDQSDGPVYGQMSRYESDSVYCGAIHAVLTGAELPFAQELRAAFASGGKDRIGYLTTEVPARHRPLLAAISSAMLQSERVVGAIKRHSPLTPTVYVVCGCVTLNRAGADTELLCGIHVIDQRTGSTGHEHLGLDTDPAAYRLTTDLGKLVVTNGEAAE